jgi:23S rRNA (uracil1939-C5)-methyltransferase
MSLCVGQKIQLDIHAPVSDGRGLARHEGLAVFVADALPGQRVEATVLAVRARLAEARLDLVVAEAPDARPAACPHSDPHGGACGGCAWQAMPYARQLAWKERFVLDALQRIGRVPEPPVLPMLPSPSEWGYRNKMEFAFAGQGADLSLGLRRRAAHGIVDVTGCLLQTERTMRVVEAVRRAARRGNLAAWSRESGGWWRFLVIREPAAGGCLVELIVAPHPDSVRHGLAVAETVFTDCGADGGGVGGFVLSERAASSDVAYGERTLLCLRPDLERDPGAAELEEDLGGLRVKLGIGAFFQVNTPAAARLHAEAVRMAAQTAGDPVRTLWDLYCGVGSLGLYLARGLNIPVLRGVEQSGRAVRLARRNAAAPGLPAVSAGYEEGDVLRRIGKLAARGTPDMAAVDPPRAGLGPGVAAALCRLRPGRLLYVSCDPATLARDAALLTRDSAPYRLAAVRPVDFFPQTPHVECVALFVRKEPA